MVELYNKILALQSTILEQDIKFIAAPQACFTFETVIFDISRNKADDAKVFMTCNWALPQNTRSITLLPRGPTKVKFAGLSVIIEPFIREKVLLAIRSTRERPLRLNLVLLVIIWLASDLPTLLKNELNTVALSLSPDTCAPCKSVIMGIFVLTPFLPQLSFVISHNSFEDDFS
ncbi:hypothetical protein NQ317_014543, partial [Molorchus minor]